MSRPPTDPKKALGKTAQKGVAWSFLREGVSEILLFPASMVLARLLSPAEFGIAVAAGFFIMLAGRLSELGFNAAIVRSKVIEPIHLSTVFVAQLALGALTFALMFSLAPVIGAFYGLPEPAVVIRLSSIAFLITPLGAVPSALLQRRMEFKKSATIDWLQLTVYSLTSVGLAALGFGYKSIVYSRLASAFTSTALRIYFARWRPSFRFSRAAFWEILPSGAGFFVKRLLDYAAQNGDNLVVGKALGVTALGLYDKAYSTMDRFLGRMNTGGPNVMFRIFATIHEDPARIQRAYRKVMMSASMLGFPVFAGLGLTAPQVIEVLFGPKWSEASLPFAVMCATGALKLLNSYASAATQAAGLIWSEVWRQVLYTAMIVLGIVALRNWGTSGAAVAVFGATAVMSVLMHILLKRVTHMPWREIARPLVPALMCSGGVGAIVLLVEFAMRRSMADPGAWLLAACQLSAAGLFVVLFTLFAPHKELRSVVLEVAETLTPAALKRHRWARTYFASQVAATSEPESA